MKADPQTKRQTGRQSNIIVHRARKKGRDKSKKKSLLK